MARTIQNGIGSSNQNMLSILGELQKGVTDCLFNTGGLAIGSSAKAKVLIANTIYASINGVLVKKTTAEIALAGTVVADTFNVFVLSLAADGTVTATMGTAGATIGAVVFPALPAGDVMIGFVIINPTGTGNFVGATTDLDDATVAPNAVYVNSPFCVNPNALAL